VSFGGTLSGSSVLHATAEKNKPLLDTFQSFIQQQSPSTKITPFPIVSTSNGRNEHDQWIFRRFHQLIDCASEMVETNKPSHTTIQCANLLLSPLPVFCSKLERKWRFCRCLSARTTTKSAHFKLTTTGSTVLDTIAEKKEYSYEYFYCLSRPQFPLPV